MSEQKVTVLAIQKKTLGTPEENLEKQGTVYYDPETDKYYIIANDGARMTIDTDD